MLVHLGPDRRTADGRSTTRTTVWVPWWNYTNNPVLWMNYRCLPGYPRGSIQARHVVSAGIGNIMGMGVLNSSGYNSRVMNMTAWSQLNVPIATTYDGSSEK